MREACFLEYHSWWEAKVRLQTQTFRTCAGCLEFPCYDSPLFEPLSLATPTSILADSLGILLDLFRALNV